MSSRSTAAVAGLLVGIDRSEHGQVAGLRTTLLVCLAAAISMVEMNPLLGVSGKHSGSFAVMDVMRLPLGILSGMGFIGAGEPGFAASRPPPPCGISQGAGQRELAFVVCWRARGAAVPPPSLIGNLAREPGVLSLRWNPADSNL